MDAAGTPSIPPSQWTQRTTTILYMSEAIVGQLVSFILWVASVFNYLVVLYYIDRQVSMFIGSVLCS